MQLHLWNREPGKRRYRLVVCGALAVGWVAGAVCWSMYGEALSEIAGARFEQLFGEEDGGRTGTGFVFSQDGYVITNAHVVDECDSVAGRIQAEQQELILLATDYVNDLALLRLRSKPTHFGKLRDHDALLAEPVLVAGYPMQDALSSTIHITTGEVSNLAGLYDNTSTFQTSAPIQRGNSGSPVLDQAGNVIGVAYAILDADVMLEEYGDIAQNVGFVIKASVVRSFLESNSIPYTLADAPEALEPALMAAEAARFTLALTCDPSTE